MAVFIFLKFVYFKQDKGNVKFVYVNYYLLCVLLFFE